MKFPPMPRFSPLLILTAWAILANGGHAASAWPQYRGPNASGVDASAALPTKWDVATGENIRWQTPIPGLAHASPIVWGEQVFVATAVSADGKSDLKVGL